MSDINSSLTKSVSWIKNVDFDRVSPNSALPVFIKIPLQGENKILYRLPKNQNEHPVFGCGKPNRG